MVIIISDTINRIKTFLYFFQVFPSDVIPLHGDTWTLGQATSAIVESHYLSKTCFIIDYHYLNDQFLDGFKSKIENYQLNNSQYIIYRDDEDIATLSLKLTLIKEQGYRLIIAHIPSFKIRIVFELCQQQGYFKPGFAWILSEMSMPGSDVEEQFYPPGLLGLLSKEMGGFGSLIEKSLVSFHNLVEDINLNNDLISFHNNSIFRDYVFR